MLDLFSVSLQTPFGPFHLIVDTHQIVRASGFGALQDLRSRLPKELRTSDDLPAKNDHGYANKIMDYCNGDLDALNVIPYQQNGSAYSQSAWEAMSSIKPGQTESYKHVAAKTISPLAVRAAGTACGQNRLILLIPCHRVVKSDGSLGNYLYGSDIKKALLEHELRFA